MSTPCMRQRPGIRRKWMQASLIVGLALASTTPTARADLYDDQWIEVSSPNFTIMSHLPEIDTRALIGNLEIFRQLVLFLTGSRSVDAAIPTRILAVHALSEWTELEFPDNYGGFFIPGLRSNLVAIRWASETTKTATIQHEYVHYLLHNGGPRLYPMWYNEGFAEFMSTVDVRGDSVVLGLVPARHVLTSRAVKWIPIGQVIETTAYAQWPDERLAMFYAESWALVHYLIQGSSYADSFTTRMGVYLEGLERGLSGREAFEAAFEIDMMALDRKLKAYLENGKFPGFEIPLDRFVTEPELTVRTPAPHEIPELAGELQLRLGELDAARASFERALKDDPGSARANAGLGYVLLSENKYVEAASHFKAAVESAGDDPIANLDWGSFLMARAAAAQDPKAATADIQLARSYFVKAWQLDDSVPEPYARYGQTYVALGDDPARAIEMLEHAERLHPSDLWIRTGLAEGYLAVGRDADAARAAQTVLLWSHLNSVEARRARDVLAMLEALQRRGDPPAAAR